MTEMDMRTRIAEYCDMTACNGCEVATDEDAWCNYHNPNNLPIDKLKPIMVELGLASEEAIDPMKALEALEVLEPPMESDPIKHPDHYCREGAMECIDEMVMVFGKEVVKNFCLCNIWKYRYRSNSKNGEEDIKKSDEYIRIYKRLCSNG